MTSTKWRWRIITAALLIAGILALAYSPAAQWLGQRSDAALIADLDREVGTAPHSTAESRLAEADSYNRTLALGGIPTQSYLQMVSIYPDRALARLRIPAINLDQAIHHTMDESVLSRGLGHMEGSSLPVGGEDTNAVIGGHRGMASIVGFTYLNEVGVGDAIYLDTLGQTLLYQVVSTEVLTPGEADMQPIQPGRDLVTLVTCTPLGLNTDRIVVIAERVLPIPAAMANPDMSDIPGFPWWAVFVAAGVSATAFYLLYPKLRNRNHDNEN